MNDPKRNSSKSDATSGAEAAKRVASVRPSSDEPTYQLPLFPDLKRPRRIA
jgi:hypothetical protein